MTDNFENKICYFCDVPQPYPSWFLSNYNELCVCYNCEYFMLPINYNNTEHAECCVCFEETALYKLPSCNHKLCIKCCKTIYFGSTTNKRPVHWREMNIESPEWPYDLDDDKEMIKYDEYCKYEEQYFDTETHTYDELIEIRNSLIPKRPSWMNREAFINYENLQFRYHTEFVKIDNGWEEYNANKTKGNKSCPLCRKKPSYQRVL